MLDNVIEQRPNVLFKVRTCQDGWGGNEYFLRINRACMEVVNTQRKTSVPAVLRVNILCEQVAVSPM